jgi:hypothetical protein
MPKRPRNWNEKRGYDSKETKLETLHQALLAEQKQYDRKKLAYALQTSFNKKNESLQFNMEA